MFDGVLAQLICGWILSSFVKREKMKYQLFGLQGFFVHLYIHLFLFFLAWTLFSTLCLDPECFMIFLSMNECTGYVRKLKHDIIGSVPGRPGKAILITHE